MASLRFSSLLIGIVAVAATLSVPLVLGHSFAIAVITQIGIMVIFALSYNMLFGQCGMLSFGHAVFFGLGAFVSAHAMNMLAATALPTPLPVVPLVGGIAGLGFGILFGFLATRTTGTIFALVTLGIGELVRTALDLVPDFSGGESGIVTDRVIGTPLLGLSFGPQREVYFLVIFWAVISLAVIYFLTLTPLGRMASAVRDNPDRATFTGYNVSYVRFLQFCLATFFAGIAGGLSAINFEFVSVESVGLFNSGSVLIATVIGGSGYFLGPVAGAAIFVLFVSLLSVLTKAWMLYLGVFFLAVILFIPGGLAGGGVALVAACRRASRRELVSIVFRAGAMGCAAVGSVGLIETLYRFSESGSVALTGVIALPLSLGGISIWMGSTVLLAASLAVFIFWHYRQRGETQKVEA